MEFIRDDKNQSGGGVIPFLEQATAETAPFYTTSLTMPKAIQKLTLSLARLGGILIEIQNGYFPFESPEYKGKKFKRYGGVIAYMYSGRMGYIKFAGLPILREETAIKVARSRVQAVLIVNSWLTATYTQKVFTPGDFANPLILHLLVDGKNTVSDVLHGKGGNLPQISAPAKDYIEGEFIEE